jgi:hypothetical protein
MRSLSVGDNNSTISRATSSADSRSLVGFSIHLTMAASAKVRSSTKTSDQTGSEATEANNVMSFYLEVTLKDKLLSRVRLFLQILQLSLLDSEVQ